MDSRRSWKGQLSLKESEHRRYSDSEEQKSKTSVSKNNSGKIIFKLTIVSITHKFKNILGYSSYCLIKNLELFKIKID